MAESGLPGFAFEGWLGVLAPRNTPQPIVDRLNQALAKTLASPVLSAALMERGVTIAASGPKEFGAFMKADIEKWKAIARDSKIQVD